LQRKAMEFYLNHLEMDYIQLQKEKKLWHQKKKQMN
jgi:hypothetical protein